MLALVDFYIDIVVHQSLPMNLLTCVFGALAKLWNSRSLCETHGFSSFDHLLARSQASLISPDLSPSPFWLQGQIENLVLP